MPGAPLRCPVCARGLQFPRTDHLWRGAGRPSPFGHGFAPVWKLRCLCFRHRANGMTIMGTIWEDPQRRQCSPARLTCPREHQRVPTKDKRPATQSGPTHTYRLLVLMLGRFTRRYCTSKSGSLQLRRHDDDCKERRRYNVALRRSRRASNSWQLHLGCVGASPFTQ